LYCLLTGCDIRCILTLLKPVQLYRRLAMATETEQFLAEMLPKQRAGATR
jgi:hypothetical protein